MVAYVFANGRLLIFGSTGAAITLNSVGHPFDHTGNMVIIKTADGLKNDGASRPRAITKPAMPIQVTDII